MKRFVLIALAIAPLAACDTTKVTQTFGEVVIHTAPAPTVKPEIGTPVSFDVLCNEIRGIGLNIKLERTASQLTNADEE